MKKIAIAFFIFFGLPAMLLIATLPPAILFLLTLGIGIAVIARKRASAVKHVSSLAKISVVEESRMRNSQVQRTDTHVPQLVAIPTQRLAPRD